MCICLSLSYWPHHFGLSRIIFGIDIYIGYTHMYICVCVYVSLFSIGPIISASVVLFLVLIYILDIHIYTFACVYMSLSQPLASSPRPQSCYSWYSHIYWIYIYIYIYTCVYIFLAQPLASSSRPHSYLSW